MATRSSAREILATNLRRLRKAEGITQAVLAERAGCSPTMIGNIEITKRFPSAEHLDRLASALGVPIHELFMEDSPAIPRILLRTEVRERLEKRLLGLLGDALDGTGEPERD